MNECVLDASAVLALLFTESGHERVSALTGTRLISAVNVGEVLTRLHERTGSLQESQFLIAPLRLEIIDHSHAQAVVVASLRPLTRSLGLSYGDRACLSLALQYKCRVLTTDRVWASLDLGIPIDVIR